MRKIIFGLLMLMAVFFGGGCRFAALAASPGPYDRKIPAEYQLKDRQDEKVLVVVEESAGAAAGLDVRQKLGTSVHKILVERAKLKPKNVILFDESEYYRNKSGLSSQVSPVEMGKELGAGLVLYVRIMNYTLEPSGPKNYYVGSMIARSFLLDLKDEEVVWPKDGNPKLVRMAINLETKGMDGTVDKLLSSTAHGIARNLYDVRMRHYRTSAELQAYE